MFLKCNGKVTICCTDEYDTFDIGNWREEKLFDLWNNEKMKFYRGSIISNNCSAICSENCIFKRITEFHLKLL